MTKEPTLITEIFLNARRVKKLPKRAVRGEVIFNKADNHFYMGIKEVKPQEGENEEK